MNSLRNKVQLIGYLSADPEVKTYDGKKPVAHITIATNENYTNEKGEKVENTQWHRLTCWGKKAEFAEDHLKKGCEIAIEGRLKNNSYEDKEGNKK